MFWLQITTSSHITSVGAFLFIERVEDRQPKYYCIHLTGGRFGSSVAPYNSPAATAIPFTTGVTSIRHTAVCFYGATDIGDGVGPTIAAAGSSNNYHEASINIQIFCDWMTNIDQIWNRIFVIIFGYLCFGRWSYDAVCGVHSDEDETSDLFAKMWNEMMGTPTASCKWLAPSWTENQPHRVDLWKKEASKESKNIAIN